MVSYLKKRPTFNSFVLLLSFFWSSSALSENILVMSATGMAFSEVVEGLKGDLEEDFKFSLLSVSKNTSVEDVSSKIKESNPNIIVLIGNGTVNLYTQYQKENPKVSFQPSVSVAALFVDRFVKKMKNATGIRYEIPVVTSILGMRSLLTKRVKKVGVVYRALMQDVIDENAKYSGAEGVELVSVKLPNKDSKMEVLLKDKLDKLIDNDIDAIWMLNDNGLLNSKTISRAWIPVLSKAEIPVIVGVESLLASKFGLGSFAIIPDHYGLGVQAASVVIEIMEDDWSIGDREVEQPLSVKKIVNINVLDSKGIPYNKEGLTQFDKVLN